jgi:hypothetical protein
LKEVVSLIGSGVNRIEMGGNTSWGKCGESRGRLKRLEKGGNRLVKIKDKTKKKSKRVLNSYIEGIYH